MGKHTTAGEKGCQLFGCPFYWMTVKFLDVLYIIILLLYIIMTSHALYCLAPELCA